mgnify:CR=1 FL=1
MSILPKFFGHVENGKIALDEGQKTKEYIQKFEGKQIEITVGPKKRDRTNAENRYYWGVIIRMIADEMGVYPEQAHELMKWTFLRKGVEVRGRRWEITQSTTDLATTEFEDYAEKCRIWAAAELNCAIPLPGEVSIDLGLDEVVG